MLSLLRPLAIIAVLSVGPLANAGTIRLTDGTRIPGHATGYDEVTEVLSWMGDDGQARELPLDKLDKRSTYSVLRSQVPRDEGDGQLQLANFTRDIELFAHAVRHYDYAAKADPSLKPEIDKQMAILRSKAAKWGMTKAREAAQKGDIKAAQKWLEKIILKLPDEPEAAEAQRLIDEHYAKLKAKDTEAIDNAVDEVLRDGLKGAKKSYDSMLEKNQKALKQPKGGSASVKGWESAIKDGEKVHKAIDKFEKKHPEQYSELLDGYRKAVDDQVIEIYMHIASHWATRSSYNKALAQVNQALAIQPGNVEALGMRNRIQDAASRGLGWW